jgi:carboxyl-terminal processing protease
MKKYVLFLSVIIFITGPAFLDTTRSKQFEITKNLEIFANLYKELNTHYVDEVDPSKLMRTGIESMLHTLDPYTNYISESDIESYRYMTDGRYDGIGANIRKIGDFVTIVEPFEGGPAIEAGIRAGDMIIAVDGKSTEGKTADEISDILRGYPVSREENIRLRMYRIME